MRITKRQLRRIVREEIIRESWSASDDREETSRMAPPGGSYAPHEDPDGPGAAKDTEVWEAVQQNVEEPSFAEWLGEELGSGPDPEMVMDAVQQNLNDSGFVDWLYNELGLGG
jgi:hypothetical protein